MKFAKHLHWFIYALFLLACARQTTPTGGPKDTIPPILVRSYPAREQVNFKGNRIELEFSEALQPTVAKDQIIIAPDMGKEFTPVVKKNRVVINFKNNFKDSTTYSVNFRDAVQDLTEKNPAVNLKLAFSTGTYIDSLSITGKITDALTAEDVKDATVAIYLPDTFNIFKHKPVYLTRTNDKGQYAIENLKPGEYRIYAIGDKNKNLIADSRNESFGFLPEKVILTNDVKNINVPLFRLDSRPLKLTNSRPYGTYFNIKFSKNLEDFKISSPENELIISSFGEDQTNIRIYNTIEAKDSSAIRLVATDSIHNRLDTTFYMKFNKRQQLKPEAMKYTVQQTRVIGTKGIFNSTIAFTKPLLNIRFDSLFYQIDSAKIVPITQADLTWDSLRNVLTIKKQFDKALLIKPEPSPADKTTKPAAPSPDSRQSPKARKPLENTFVIGRGTFIGIERDTTAATRQVVKPTTLEETGIIFVNTNTKSPHYIIQLLSSDRKIIDQRFDTPKVQFDDLAPADYMIRLVIDTDGNGKWSPGNFITNTPPETVVYYRNDKKQHNVTLKANWELGPLLITY